MKTRDSSEIGERIGTQPLRRMMRHLGATPACTAEVPWSASISVAACLERASGHGSKVFSAPKCARE
jgi:hypothetical protein